MQLQKRTYALPQATLDRFEQAVTSGKRSATVAHLLDQWLEQEYQKRLRQEIIAGCQEMSEVYLDIEREFHPLEEEVARAQQSG